MPSGRWLTIRISLLTALGLVLLAVSPGFVTAAERLTAVSDRSMPYNGRPGSAREGYAVELLRTVFERRGFELEYRELPWTRAVEDVLAGSADILIGAVPAEQEGLVYPREPLGRADLCFYTNRADWEYTGHGSLALVVTGYVQGYAYPRWLRDDIRLHPARFNALHGEDAFTRLLRMLSEDRVQAVPGSRAVADYSIRENGLEGEVRLAGCSDEDSRDLYFAFTPVNGQRSRELAALLDQGIASLRNTGQLNFLLIKYGLKD